MSPSVAVLDVIRESRSISAAHADDRYVHARVAVRNGLWNLHVRMSERTFDRVTAACLEEVAGLADKITTLFESIESNVRKEARWRGTTAEFIPTYEGEGEFIFYVAGDWHEYPDYFVETCHSAIAECERRLSAYLGSELVIENASAHEIVVSENVNYRPREWPPKC